MIKLKITKLSENFTLEEMIYSYTGKMSGIDNKPSEPEVKNLEKLCKTILQPIREMWGKPITVTSGFRSKALNKAVGGAPGSQHMKGEAADIIGWDNLLLWHLINKMIREGKIQVGQLINEKNLSWIHISLPNESHVNQILEL